MKKYIIILWVILLGSVVFSQMTGKRQTQYGFDINAIPPVYYDVYITFNEQNHNPQLNVLFNIQNDLLFFTKSDNGYTGGYDITLAIKDIATNSTVFSNLWKEKIFEYFKDKARFSTRSLFIAHEIGLLGFDMLRKGKGLDPREVKPFYFRRSQAEERQTGDVHEVCKVANRRRELSHLCPLDR